MTSEIDIKIFNDIEESDQKQDITANNESDQEISNIA
jgi:hypothetical protein